MMSSAAPTTSLGILRKADSNTLLANKIETQSLTSNELCQDGVFYLLSGFQAAHFKSITYFIGTSRKGACR